MKKRKNSFSDRPEPWSRLDNAAKLFPSTSEKTDTRVFRFYCELDENIEPELLQEAADISLENFPGYRVMLKKGIFWYFLEHCDLEPVVTEEALPVCAELYDPEYAGLLFRISYMGRRINLEMYHVLTDGTGAQSFIKDIVYNYLILRYPQEYKLPPVLDSEATFNQKGDDSFRRYYNKSDGKRSSTRIKRAYNLSGEHIPDNRLRIIEGIVSVKGVIEAAHRYNTTLTVFLTALFIQAIRKDMPLSGLKYPTVISVPVNLRQYFPSETARNFFGMITVPYDFRKRSGTLEDIISETDSCFRRELTKEQLAVRMNKMASIERNPFARIAPLPIKDLVLRQARHIKDYGETAVVSNLGRIVMPKEMENHIRLFGILISTLKLQMNICSFGDKLQIGFTSSFESTDIQRSFFCALTEQGIEAEIRSNDFYAEEAESEE